MTWVRLDDGFADHPKVLALSDRAFRQHVRALCYAARYLTDGHVPLGYVDGKAVDELVEAGLLTLNGDGLLIHDFLEYNPTRETVEGEREAARERMRRSRASRARSGEPSANSGRGSTAPSPAPTPTPKAESTSSRAAARRSYPESFERFWQAYPSEGRRDKPKAAAAFARALDRLAAELVTGNPERDRAEALERIILGAARYAADPNRDPSKTKYAEGWLNGDRWNDPPLSPPSASRGPAPGTRSHALARQMGGSP